MKYSYQHPTESDIIWIPSYDSSKHSIVGWV